MSDISRGTAKLGAAMLQFYGDCLSDEDYKEIHDNCNLNELLEEVITSKQPFCRHTASLLVELLGEKDSEFDDDTLQKYADYVKNYHYTYKNEARAIDPTIDPNEEHVGIMAQDIEKVNPATVKEDEAGAKEVDIGRLALMNAGAIAELAREVRSLKEDINALKTT